ncbi:MAG TPA: amino acid ABC transporter permease [Anaerolineae bacterium]|nr:amino acid ABC transporter permease [Anaerolineae bacterium]
MATQSQISSDILKPPATQVGVVGWLRRNLFSTWYNALLTLLALYVIYLITKSIFDFVTTANWGVVTNNLSLFMVGRYPADQVWRVKTSVSIFVFLIGASWAMWRGVAQSVAILLAAIFTAAAILPFATNDRLWMAGNLALVGVGFSVGYFTRARRVLVSAWLLSLPVIAILLYGVGALPQVSTNLWGGLLLTLALALVSSVASFPLGVLLAVGRQSTYPALRAFCVGYIELIRGVPLITVIFMMQIMLPLFLPSEITVERVMRAMAGFTIFTAAYIAEVVRGGLQAIPRGQIEAAHALGLNSILTLLLIILPQALRITIPALMGQFISLFKDTSLVAIVGLLDLAGIATAAANQPEFLGRQAEVYVFIALIYFVFAYGISHSSRRLERSLGVGER